MVPHLFPRCSSAAWMDTRTSGGTGRTMLTVLGTSPASSGWVSASGSGGPGKA